jgi:ABC-type antimicrobial peptide transport system permease subunit
MLDVDPRLHGYDPKRTAHMLQLAKERAAQIPGTETAAYGDSVPLSGGHRSDGMTVAGQSGPNHIVELYMVSADYLQSLGIPLIAGRDFAREDSKSPRVAVVNQEFVREFFPDGHALSRQVSDGGRLYEIIGVTKDLKSRTLGEGKRAVLFRALAQDIELEPSFSGYSLLVSYRGNGSFIAERFRRIIHEIDPGLAIVRMQTMEEHMEDVFFLPRLGSTLFTVFGALGLIPTIIGLYGLLNYWVSRRNREIGVRLAMGARVGQLQRMIVGKGLLLLAIALGPGLVAAYGLNKLYASLLYGITTGDPATFSLVPLFLMLVSALACWLPARRVAGREPLAALRNE